LISNLEENKLPRSHDISFNQGWQCEPMSPEKLNEIGGRWRNQERAQGINIDPHQI
jgi:hypothetical protein